MRRFGPTALLALATTLAGCDSVSGPGGDAGPPLTELPRALTAAEQGLIRGSNRFAFGLLRETVARDTASNVFLSPLSASMALGMTMNGARGTTLDEMRATLGFAGLDREQINASYRSLIDLLLGLDARVELRLANALWIRSGFPVHDAFVGTTRDFFDAEATTLDFSDPASLDVINDWVREGTNGRIDSILDEIDPEMVLYLMNAVYFKGSWTRQFDPGQTRDAPFRRADGTERSVRMMHLEEAPVRMLWDGEVQIVDLPYGRQAFSMTLVLPPEGGTLDDLVATLDHARWEGWTAALHEGEMDVFIPRFRLEYDRVLNETLRAMGMPTAFHEIAADFGEMSPLGEDLFIDEVRQKTFLEVNEKGTEAAAATSVGMKPTSMPPTFRADRPFLLVIRERLSGTILFLGTIGAPAE